VYRASQQWHASGALAHDKFNILPLRVKIKGLASNGIVEVIVLRAETFFRVKD
jgi:hypothetical protein